MDRMVIEVPERQPNERGQIAVMRTPDGEYEYGLVPQMFNAQIRRGRVDDDYGYLECWTYSSTASAWVALTEFSSGHQDEPLGWIRHQPSNRRRTYHGDTFTEEVRA